MIVGFEFIEMDYEEPNVIDKDVLNRIYEKIAYQSTKKMEQILTKVVEDNPNIPVTDMVLRYNTNHIPLDVITKDGDVLYDFKKEVE